MDSLASTVFQPQARSLVETSKVVHFNEAVSDTGILGEAVHILSPV